MLYYRPGPQQIIFLSDVTCKRGIQWFIRNAKEHFIKQINLQIQTMSTPKLNKYRQSSSIRQSLKYHMFLFFVNWRQDFEKPCGIRFKRK